jgi:hypothetical protein
VEHAHAHVPRPIKAEFNRQCLFWRDSRDRPLWRTLKHNHRPLARLIAGLRRKYQAAGLSDILTRAESALFVDDAAVQLNGKNIKSLSFHDGLLAGVSHLDEIRALLEALTIEHWGYVPRFEIMVDSQAVAPAVDAFVESAKEVATA